ncbi:MAG: glutathione binding-like protein, partial [Thalassobaculaceae bacterium]
MLEGRLEGRQWIVGDDYSIADMACYPWCIHWERQRQDIADFPHVKRWIDTIAERPAVKRA